MVVVFKGKLVLGIAPPHFAAVGSLGRLRAPWHSIGSRWPSGAMWGILQAFLPIAHFA